jgi:hypothetical protein
VDTLALPETQRRGPRQTASVTMRRSRHPALDWDTIGQPLFDRIIEALVQRIYGEDWDVRPIDGSGGDGGIDIECLNTKSATRHVCQLKYFPEGFSGKHGKRRQQIERSFKSLEEKPDKWILVAPCSADQGGYTFLKKLIGDTTELEFWHRARLDEMLAKNPDLVDHFAREDYGVEQAKQLALEKAVLAGGVEDLTERVLALGHTTDAVDPNWTWDFAREGDTVINTLRPRHARAAEVAPINISFEVDSTTISDEDRTALRDMDFGLEGSVTFPPGAVRGLKVEGPEIVRQGSSDEVEVTLIQPANPGIAGKAVELRLTGGASALPQVHHGVLIDGRPGPAGASLRAVFHGIVTITFLMPTIEQGASGICNVSVDYPPQAPLDTVQRATALMVDLSSSTVVQLRQGTRHLVTFCADSRLNFDRDRYGDLADLVDDLQVLADAAKNRFPMPIELNSLDRLWVRALRLALEHGHTYAPGVHGLRATLEPEILDDPVHESLLAGEPGAIFTRQEPFTVELFNQRLTLPSMSLYHPSVRMEDHERVRQELAAGTRSNIHLASTDGSTFTLIGPNYPPEGAPPVGWGLPQLAEPVAFAPAETRADAASDPA